MLQLCLIICLLTAAVPAALAQPDTLWSATIPMNDHSYLHDATELPDGSFAVCGVIEYEQNSVEPFAARISAGGDVLWSSEYSLATYDEEAVGICYADNSVILTGYAQEFIEGQGFTNHLTLMSFSLDGDSLWSRVYTPEGLSKGRDIIRLTNGNLAVTGYRLGQDNSSDAWLMMCDSSGDSLWTKTYGGSQTDVGQELFQHNDSTLYMLCNSRSVSTDGDYDFFLLQIDMDGILRNSYSFGSNEEEVGYGIDVDDNAGIWLAGRQQTDAGFLVRQPMEGEAWEQVIAEGEVLQLQGVLLRPSSALCAGWTGFSNFATQLLLIGYDFDGTHLWSWPIGSPGPDVGFRGLIQVGAGGALAYGGGNTDAGTRGYVLRTAAPGGITGRVLDRESNEPVPGVIVQVIGMNRWGFSNENGEYTIELVPGTYDLRTAGICWDGDTLADVTTLEGEMINVDITVGVPVHGDDQSSINLIARNRVSSVAEFYLTNDGSGDMRYAVFPVAINPPGDWLFVENHIGQVPAGETLTLNVTVTADTTDDAIHDYFGELVVHTNSCPETLWTVPVLATVLDTDNRLDGLPQSFRLHPVYPNPFNSTARVALDIPTPSDVRLEIFNIHGQLVTTIAAARLNAGAHEFDLDMQSYAGGLYFLRASAGSFLQTQKLLYLK